MRSSLKIFNLKFVKRCLEIEDWGQHFTNGVGEQIFNKDRHAGHYLFCHTSKLINSTNQQVNNYKKAVTTSILRRQQCKGNSAYIFENDTQCNLDQSCAGILHYSGTTISDNIIINNRYYYYPGTCVMTHHATSFYAVCQGLICTDYYYRAVLPRRRSHYVSMLSVCLSVCLSVPCLHLEKKRKGLQIPNLVGRIPGTRAPRGPISRSKGQRSRSQDTVVVSM